MKIFACRLAFLFALIAPFRADDDVNRASKILTPELATQILGSEAQGGLRNTYGDTEKGKTWVSSASYSSKAGLDPRPSPCSSGTGRTRRKPEGFRASREVLKGAAVTELGEDAYRTETPAQLDIRKGAGLADHFCRWPDPARSGAAGKSRPGNSGETPAIVQQVFRS